MLYHLQFDLDEVIFYLKDGDCSFFDYYSEYSKNDAVVNINGAGTLYICNLSEDDIPEETVRRVIDVLEHLDECLKQAYDTLVHWDFDHHTWDSKRKCFKEDPKEVFELDEILFGSDGWTSCDFQNTVRILNPSQWMTASGSNSDVIRWNSQCSSASGTGDCIRSNHISSNPQRSPLSSYSMPGMTSTET